jgi:hypothetical protein
MQHSLLALVVIPALRISDLGLIDVDRFERTDLFLPADPAAFRHGRGTHVEGSIEDALHRPLRDLFDVPDLNTTDDHIVNGTPGRPGRPLPLAPVHRAAHRLFAAPAAHYTRPAPSISRTSCSSPTTSSTSTSSCDYARACSPRPRRLREPSSSPATW